MTEEMKSVVLITKVATGRGLALISGFTNYITHALLHNLNIIFNLLSLYLGGTPYPTMSNHELFVALKAGYRMEKPQMCSDIM